MEDKVKFGIKNVHIFPRLTDEPTYGDVFAFPGAVSLSLDAQGNITKFYADDIVYYQTASNNGYEGDLEMASIIEEFFEKIINYVKDDNNVLTENTNKDTVSFAMSFEESGDQTGTKFVLYNVIATRPSLSLNTVEEEKTPSTKTISISAAPNKDGNVMSMTESTTPANVLANWHNKVYGYQPIIGSLTLVSAAGSTTGDTEITVTPAKASGNSYVYAFDVEIPELDSELTTGWTAWNGTDDITVTGTNIVVAEIDSNDKAKKAGKVKAIAAS